MRRKEAILIKARTEQVWEYVGSPEVWPLFHVKAGKCELLSSQGDAIGSTYQMEFRLGKKTSPTKCEIVDLRVDHMIQLSSTLPKLSKSTGKPPSAVITYELDDRGCETEVSERVDIDFSGINLLVRLLAWAIMRFGSLSGETTLMKLKRIVETD